MNSNCGLNPDLERDNSKYDVKIWKADKIEGRAAAPPSKSAAHRALIAAALGALCEENSIESEKSISNDNANQSASKPICAVAGVIPSDDMKATISGLRGLGIDISLEGETAFFYKRSNYDLNEKPVVVDCHESGSTLRFLIPIYAALGISAKFIGRGKLPERPLGVYGDILPKMGVAWESEGGLPLKISGKLSGGAFEIPGNVSSQFVTGLLFALPLLEEESKIVLTSPLESAAYVDMTIGALEKAGVKIEQIEEGFGGWKIQGKSHYKTGKYQVEGDWSQAAFLLAMGAIGGEVTVSGLDVNSPQGDKAIMALLKGFGAEIEAEENGDIRCRGDIKSLKGIEIDASQIPDLVPILSVIAAFSKGETRIYNAERLRIKECDRLMAMADCIAKVGGDIVEKPDGLIIKGSDFENGTADEIAISSYNDHRIVMSMAVMGMKLNSKILIKGADSINKSWPDFFKVYKDCGGNFDVF